MSTSEATADYIVNELLYAVKCHTGKKKRENIVATFADFYSEKEINDAKKVVLEIADKCNPKLGELKK